MKPEDFRRLSDAEQREVAERLIRIEQSGWKPFWCKDRHCSGDPHWVRDVSGNVTIMDESEVAGPNGEPLSGRVWETPGGDWVFEDDEEIGAPEDHLLGRIVLDPTWAHNHARADQRLPPWAQPWTLFIMSGRGAGKTTTGVEFITLCARKGIDTAILGRRGTEIVNTHVATILARAHPDFMPTHWASKDILEWPNGAITYLFSAEKPENIRSVNVGAAWVDEAAFMDEIDTAWMNLKMATRISTSRITGEHNPIHFLITSTPTPTKWVKEMEDDPGVQVRRVSTYANRRNLSKSFIRDLKKKYEGTRMGRQEIHGEVLRDVEGALWNDDLFKSYPCEDADAYEAIVDAQDDRVIAVDPAGSKGPRSDATGIIGAGAMHFDEDGNRLPSSTFDVLCRATLKGTPTEWARQTFKAARLIKAHRIVAEKNFGGDMVKQVLLDYAKLHPAEAKDENGDFFKVEVVHAQKSKETRAEAVVGKYEQGRVRHINSPDTVFGDLSELEKQQVGWVPKSRGGREPSPNDIDALVWAMRALETKVRYEGQMATQRSIKDAQVKAQRTEFNPLPPSTGARASKPRGYKYKVRKPKAS